MPPASKGSCSGRQTPTIERPKYQLWPNVKRAVNASPPPVLNKTNGATKPLEKVPLFHRRNISVPKPEPLQTKNTSATACSGGLRIHERSNSAPGWSSANTSVESLIRSAPREVASPPSFSRTRHSPLQVDNSSRSTKRASSILLPEELKVFCFAQDQQKTGESGEDQPPAVPPKSPRRPFESPPRKLPASKHTDDTVRPVQIAFSRNDSSSSRCHKRDPSQDSIMNRGRPKKKNQTLQNTMADYPVELPPDGACFTLPQGVPPQRASSFFSDDEMIKLHNQAQDQAKKFEVLRSNEVKSLSRELRLLDKRCEYLRETYSSLRSGRRSLHTRMISYLKSPRVSKFSRENILKQEEVLAELDQSIDEWFAKMELAENRRTRIRQKLLEHIAGSLVLRGPNSERDMQLEIRDASGSPVELGSPSSDDRKNVESIKVYADAELHVLFANIEREMERMVSHGSSESPTPSDG